VQRRAQQRVTPSEVLRPSIPHILVVLYVLPVQANDVHGSYAIVVPGQKNEKHTKVPALELEPSCLFIDLTRPKPKPRRLISALKGIREGALACNP